MLNLPQPSPTRPTRRSPLARSRLAGWFAATVVMIFCATGSNQPAFSATPDTAKRRPNNASSNDFGSVGLLQTRTARFRDDGGLDVGAVRIDPYQRYYISFQAMPWLEGTFRYTEITNRDFSIGGLASTEAFQDRGADLKFLLWEESKYAPQIAFGLQDGIGTGLFAGEYLVANKRYYDLDFSFGIGWGYFASGSDTKNPLTFFSDVFKTRNSGGSFGGEANFGDYLSGETIGLFGGVSWQTPVKGLSLKLEASTQDYQSEALGNQFQRDLPVNFGFVYRPFPWMELSGAYERGNIAMFRASVRANVNDAGLPKTDPAPPKLIPRPPKSKPNGKNEPATTALDGNGTFSLTPRLAYRIVQPGDPEPLTPNARLTRAQVGDGSLVDALFTGFEAQDMQIASIETEADETRIYLATGLRAAPKSRQIKVAQLVAATLPASSGRITLIEQQGDTITHQVVVTRDEIERGTIVDYLFDNLEAKGFSIESIDFNHSQARLVVSQVPNLDGDVERAAAEVVFNSAPTPVQQVEIVQVAQGLQRSRAVVRRSDVRRSAKIDQMFDSLEASGFVVESLELNKGQAKVYLSSAQRNDGVEDDYEGAARLVAEHAPTEMASVEIVRLVAGVEATRVTLRRAPDSARNSGHGPNGLTAGQEKKSTNEFIPDLTDNEKSDLALKIFKGLEAANFTVDKFEITRRKATVFVTPTKFREHARNVGRASRVVASYAPASVEEIEVVTMNAGLETARVTIMRHDLEAAVARRGSPEEVWAHTTITGPQPTQPFGKKLPDDVAVINNPRRYPTFGWDVRPALRSHIGGPDGLYLYQIWIALSASAELYRGLYVDSTFGKNVHSTLDQISLSSDSRLPHVRSDLRQYKQQGEDGNIVDLQTDYLFQPAENWFGRVSAGLFEPMFGGVGAEILYRPYNSRLAVGVELNRVRQRDYDQRLDFRDYEITTGHLNVYYKSPYMGLVGEIHVGQFLAGDRGAQFAVSRQFDSGIAVGAWVTFTNVSAEEFGEGSFDKGIFMRIPFEAFLATSTLRGGSLAFRPLTRDGGQIVLLKRRLYGIVENGNLDNVMHKWDRLLD